VLGLGFRGVLEWGLGVQSLGRGVWCLGLNALGFELSGWGVWGLALGLRCLRFGFKILIGGSRMGIQDLGPGVGVWAKGIEFGVQSFGCMSDWWVKV